jgi:ERCC4-type nuclease
MSDETTEKTVLYIDTREKKLLPHIQSEYIEKQLDLGDIFIDSPSYKLMIERKTISDFNASLRDGRYRNQKLRLLEWRDTDITTKRVIYILETNSDTKDSAYWGAVINASLRDNIIVIQTDNTKKTAEIIDDIKKKVDENKFENLKITRNEIYLEGCNNNKKGDYSNPETFYLGALTLIPGISKNISAEIVQRFPTLILLIDEIKKNLANTELKMKKRLQFLSDIKINERRLGDKLAEKICNYLLPN